jgi:hypothetical protein
MPPLGALPVASFAHRRRPIMLRDRGCPRSRPRIAALSERGRGRVIRNMGDRRFDPASISQQCLRHLAIVTTAAGSRNRIDWDPSWIPSGFGRAGSRTNVGNGAIAAIRVTGIEAVRRSKVEIWAGRPPACTARPRDGASGRGKLRRVRKGLLAGHQQHRRASFRGLENPTREKRQEGLALRPLVLAQAVATRRRRSTTRRCWCTAGTAGAK